MKMWFRCVAVLSFLCAFVPNLWANPPLSPTDAATSVNAFAAAYQRDQPAGNSLISPWSITTNMAMVATGANGETLAALQRALCLPPDEKLGPAFRDLSRSIIGESGPNIRTANRAFCDSSLKLLPSWTAKIREHFAAAPGVVDFHNDPVDAEQAITQWVKEQTDGLIQRVAPKMAGPTQLVLVNAVYFRLPWEKKFVREKTQIQPFQVKSTQVQMVPLMFKQHPMRYARKAGFQIAALPYAGGDFQFVVFLPDAVDGIYETEAALTKELIAECTTLPSVQVQLHLPRMRLTPDPINIKQALYGMGAGVAFQGGADFSRMVEGSGLSIEAVFHRAHLELDEDGTTAAADTETYILSRGGGGAHKVKFQVVRCDHPFLFMIQHIPSGACLFLGRFSEPPSEFALAPVSSSAPPKEGPLQKN